MTHITDFSASIVSVLKKQILFQQQWAWQIICCAPEPSLTQLWCREKIDEVLKECSFIVVNYVASTKFSQGPGRLLSPSRSQVLEFETQMHMLHMSTIPVASILKAWTKICSNEICTASSAVWDCLSKNDQHCGIIYVYDNSNTIALQAAKTE